MKLKVGELREKTIIRRERVYECECWNFPGHVPRHGKITIEVKEEVPYWSRGDELQSYKKNKRQFEIRPKNVKF